MKKIFFSAALAAMMMASCQNENLVNSNEMQEEFTVEVTKGMDSRVYMDGSVAKWSADDALYVYGTNGVRGTLYLTSGANSKTATFTGVISGSSKNLTNAIFGNVTHKGDDISLALNNVNADECDAPMFGAFSSDKGSISLDYICGLVPVKINNAGSGDLSNVKLGGVGVSTLSLVDGKWVPGAAYADITIVNVHDGQTFYVPFFTTTEENAVKTPLTIKVGANASYTYAPNTKSGALSTTEAPVLTYNTSSGSLTPTTETSANKNIGVSTLDKLKAALSTGQTEIALNNDIKSSEVITISSSVVLYGNGHTITYTGTKRAITVENSANGANLTLKDLNIECSANPCERGVNYNTTGTLILENVHVYGEGLNYALSLPGSSDGVTVSISNSTLEGKNTLNIWGSNSTITITDSNIISAGSNEIEDYAAIMLNNNGDQSADGSTINIIGGEIKGTDTNGDPCLAIYNESLATITISKETNIIGQIIEAAVAIIKYNNGQFYSFTTLEDAVSEAQKGETIKLINNVELTDNLNIDKNITIDLNGHTLDLGEYSIKLGNGGSLSIKTNGGQIEGTLPNGTIVDGE